MIFDRGIALYVHTVRYKERVRSDGPRSWYSKAALMEDLPYDLYFMATNVAKLACADRQCAGSGHLEYQYCAHKLHDCEPPVLESRCDQIYDRFYRRGMCSTEQSREIDRCVVEEYGRPQPWCLVSVHATSHHSLELTVENSTRRSTFKTQLGSI